MFDDKSDPQEHIILVNTPNSLIHHQLSGLDKETDTPFFGQQA